MTEVFPLKKTVKYVLSALVVVLAGVMAFQAVALSPGGLSGNRAAAACAPGAVVVKTISKQTAVPEAPKETFKTGNPDTPAALKPAAPAETVAPVAVSSGAVVQAAGDETPFGTQIIPGVYYDEKPDDSGPQRRGHDLSGYDYDITNGVFCTRCIPGSAISAS